MSAPAIDLRVAELLRTIGEVRDQFAQGDVVQALELWDRILEASEHVTDAVGDPLVLRDRLYLYPAAAIACRCGRALEPADMYWASTPHVAESDENVVLPPIVCGVCFVGGRRAR